MGCGECFGGGLSDRFDTIRFDRRASRRVEDILGTRARDAPATPTDFIAGKRASSVSLRLLGRRAGNARVSVVDRGASRRRRGSEKGTARIATWE
jgi:hypothetical protein